MGEGVNRQHKICHDPCGKESEEDKGGAEDKVVEADKSFVVFRLGGETGFGWTGSASRRLDNHT